MISDIRFPKLQLVLNLLLFIALSFFLVSVFFSSKTSALSGSQFNAGNIIDDSVFFNKHTMSDHQIQAFLNSKVPACDTWHARSNSSNDPGPPYTCLRDYTQAVPNIAGNSYCSGIGGNGTVYSAAQIISIVSQHCGVNPQTLIVLLQKEQSLITDTWPWPIQYRSATGYGCPDTAPCDAEFYGYFNQVYKAAWQFKRYVDLPQNYNYAAGRTSFIAYHPNGGCGGSNVTVQNGATAALYNYTPYQPNQAALNDLYGNGDLADPSPPNCSSFGNRNFWRMFNDWFGSTNGDLVRTPGNATVYLISGSNKYPIASQSVLNDFGALGPIRFVSDEFVGSFTTGNVLRHMVQGPDLSLYLVNAGIKLPFTSCLGDVVDYGYTCDAGQYASLTQAQVNKLASGPAVTKLVKSNNNGTIYYMSGGKKRAIPSWSDLQSLHIPISYNVLTDALVSGYANGALLFGAGSLVKTSASGTVYVVKDLSSLYPITSFTFPSELGLPGNLRIMSASDFSTYSVQSSNLQNKVNCNSTNYLGTNGVNYPVSNPIRTTYGFNPSDFLSVGNELCSNMNLSGQALGRYLRTPNGSIYYINDSGQKQAFTSYGAYTAHQSTNGNPGYINASEFFASSLPNGTNL